MHKVKIFDSLCDLDLVAPNLWFADQCFGHDTFDWLLGIADTQGNHFQIGALKKRLQLVHDCDDHSRLNEIGCAQTTALSNLSGVELEFIESKYWVDLPQFGCQVHADAQDLYVNYQIYLHASPGADVECVGAEFLHVDPPYQVPLKPNAGYININCDLKPHWVYGGHGTRTSVMFQYRRV